MERNWSKFLGDLLIRYEALNTSSETTSAAYEAAAEIELRIGRTLVKQGAPQEAAEILTSAAQHTQEVARKTEIGSQLLLLAKALARPGKTASDMILVEHILKQAAEIVPRAATATLAQHLQRQERYEEAVTAWQEAVRQDPQDGNRHLSLARVYERLGQPELALRVYLEFINVAPTAKNYLIVAQRLEELSSALPAPRPQQVIKIALQGNATLDHLQSYLKVECYRANLRPVFYQGGFDQYTQEIMNEHSRLYTFAPDVLICAIHASRLFPKLHDYPFDLSVDQRRNEIDAGLDKVRNLLTTFTQRRSALVLLHNMVAPQYPGIGIADLRDDFGQSAAFAEINLRLAEIVRSEYHNVYLIDEDRVQARIGKARATDSRLWLTARLPWSDATLSELAHEYMRYLTAYKGLTRKCIVLDLDNTLWGGVVGEDGVSGVQIGPDAPGNAFWMFQHELEKLWKRGLLLAICSKNNPEDALAVFEQHPGMLLKLSHFAAQRINWQEKSANIREIAQELNIGLDSLVFLDDNPVERAKMRAEVPEVLTPELPLEPAQYRSALLALGVFDNLTMTDEDRNRNRLYADQKERREYQQQQRTGSLEEFLANLEMSVEITPANNVTLPRIAQLTNKTNQFNLTTRRYTEAQLIEMLTKGWHIYSMRVSDRFGDNGVVGVVILAPRPANTWEIDTLLLSCRVMGRGVETALLTFVAQQAQTSGIRRLNGWYLPTPKNTPVKDFYRQHGFGLVGEDDNGGELWELDPIGSDLEIPNWLSVQFISEMVGLGSSTEKQVA